MGFYVSDMARVEDFYSRVLEFTVTDRGTLQTPHGEVRLVFLSRDPAVHHQIVLANGRPEHLAFNPINEISLEADSLDTLRQSGLPGKHKSPAVKDRLSGAPERLP